MRDNAKASSDRSSSGRGNLLGLFGRAFATRGASSDGQGSGAPAGGRPRPLLASLAVALLGVLGALALWGAASAGAASSAGSGWSGLAPALSPLPALTPASGTAPTTFAETGSEAGQIQDPRGMAVDNSTGAASSGDLYIADQGNRRIDKFGAEGKFKLAWGWGVADGTSSAFQTCGPESANPECFHGVYNESSTGAIGSPAWVAVNQSTHGVYVDGGGYRIQEFSPLGQFILMFGKEVNKTAVAASRPVAEQNVCPAPGHPNDTCGEGVRGSGPGQLNYGYHPVALDSAGHVWIADSYGTPRLEEFNADGSFTGTEVTPSGTGRIEALAINSSGDFFALRRASFSEPFHGVIEDNPLGGEIETIDSGSYYSKAIALDGSGDLYVADRSAYGAPAVFREFAPNGSGKYVQIEQFGSGQVFGEGGPQGIAIGNTAESHYSNSNAFSPERYAAQRFSLPKPGFPLPGNEHTEKILPTEATLKATLNPENHETKYHFEYDTAPYSSPSEAAHGTKIPVPDASLAQSFNEGKVEAALSHLIPSTVYHWRLVAESECEGPSPACVTKTSDQTFTTLPAVGIEAEWVTDVAATSATFHGKLNPLGVAAEWWLEYDTSPYGEGEGPHGTSVPVPPGSLAAGFGEVPVGMHVTGLQSGTAYHYRFAASDVREGHAYTVHGADRQITTQLSGLGFQLPDARAWEQVSPTDKHGGAVGVLLSVGVTQSAADGNGLTYLSVGSIEAGPEGNRSGERSQVLSRRDARGWRSEDITPAHTEAANLPIGSGEEYKLFSPDLARAVLDARDATPLSNATSERTPYLRDNLADPATYQPLVVGCPGGGKPCSPAVEEAADVPPGTKFGGEQLQAEGKVVVRGASPDLSHVVVQSSVPLATGAPGGALYEWAGSRLQAVSVEPGGTIVEGELGAGNSGARNAVSTDGSRVFWTRTQYTYHPLFVTDTATGESVQIDAVHGGAGGGENPVFQGANAEGTRVFFTDEARLTPDASKKGADLYVCDLVTGGSGKLECRLTDLTPNGREGAGVQGVVSGFGEAGRQVYVVANGLLGDAAARGAGSGDCEEYIGSGLDPSETCNLYLLRFDSASGEWKTRFIATLSIEDGNDWGYKGGLTAVKLTAAASPSGRYLAFMSQRSLTGYDNRDAATGERDEEVYRYDAEANGGAGELICVSCNPSGGRPAGLAGFRSGTVGSGERVDPGGLWAGSRVAASVPDPIAMSLSYASRQPRFALDNGRVLFNAADALVPADSNGTWDVYEYEPTGTGSCQASSGGGAVSRGAGGCVALLSSGASEEESALADASESGNDVFFFSAAQLSVLDEDKVYDVYDARVGGTPARRELTPECLGEACQPPPNVPNDTGPSSSSFEGPGNVSASKPAVTPKRLTRAQKLSRALSACRKRYRKSKKRRVSCERQARRSYAASRSSRKANSSKRGGK